MNTGRFIYETAIMDGQVVLTAIADGAKNFDTLYINVRNDNRIITDIYGLATFIHHGYGSGDARGSGCVLLRRNFRLLQVLNLRMNLQHL